MGFQITTGTLNCSLLQPHFVKANKLVNQKDYPWPKHAVFVYKRPDFHCEEQCICSSSSKKQTMPM